MIVSLPDSSREFGVSRRVVLSDPSLPEAQFKLWFNHLQQLSGSTIPLS
jgi:hypothetical protein